MHQMCIDLFDKQMSMVKKQYFIEVKVKTDRYKNLPLDVRDVIGNYTTFEG